MGNGQAWIGSDGVMSLIPSSFNNDNNNELINTMNGFIGTYVSFNIIIEIINY